MDPSHRAPAVTRAIGVLKLLGRSGEPLGVNAIARELDLVPSSCLHILRALADDGLVHADPKSKQYTLGLGLLALAHDMLGRNQFARMVQPELDTIARKYGVTATAVELDGRDRMVVVAMAQAATILKIQVGLGSRFPAYISATGRCIAAQSGLSEAQLKQRFAALQWQSPPKFSDWLLQVEAARSNGVAEDIGNYITGFTVAAAAVNGQGGEARHFISVVGVSEQLTGKTLASVKRDTKRAAQRVSDQLNSLR
jgi:DNA-binding IclR family transcriptional regulator